MTRSRPTSPSAGRTRRSTARLPRRPDLPPADPGARTWCATASDYDRLVLHADGAAAAADAARRALVVYDCMDELSAFKDAPRQLLQRESALLKRADLVFTGGPEPVPGQADRHPNVHCFPSSVDAAHFAPGARPRRCAQPATRRDIAAPAPRLLRRHRRAPRPRAARPRWPTPIPTGRSCWSARSSRSTRPTLPQQPEHPLPRPAPYEELPRFLAGWDVCLLPFALNEATRFISPTKTLEYMAAEQADRQHADHRRGRAVRRHRRICGDTPSEFIAACERALARADAEARERARQRCATRRCASTSWDATAAAMARADRRGRRPARRAADACRRPARRPPLRPAQPRPRGRDGRDRRRPHRPERRLSPRRRTALLLEQNDTRRRLVPLDRGQRLHVRLRRPHHVLERPVRARAVRLLLGDNVHWQDREAWIYSKDVYTRYPFQGALYGLPPEVIKECIVGAIEARFGSLKQKPAAQRRQRRRHGPRCTRRQWRAG